MSGSFFDDFQIGQEFTSGKRTITENDILQFADLSGDHNPLHLDEEYAKTTPFGGRVAHGLLGLSIASGLWAQLGLLERTIIAFLGLEWKFSGPVRVGDRVHVVVTVAEKRKSRLGDRGIVHFSAALFNQKNESVQEGRWTALIRGRSDSAS